MTPLLKPGQGRNDGDLRAAVGIVTVTAAMLAFYGLVAMIVWLLS